MPIDLMDVEPISQMGPGRALGATVANRPLPRTFGLLGVRRIASNRLAARFDIADTATGRIVHERVRARFIDLPGHPEGALFAPLGSQDIPTRMLLIGRHGQITFPDGGQRTLSHGSYTCAVTVRADDHDAEATGTRRFIVQPSGSTWAP